MNEPRRAHDAQTRTVLREQRAASAWAIVQDEVTACRRCPRLVTYREEIARTKRRAYRSEEYWGRPVPAFGSVTARVLLYGLAPGAHGSNRTGRMFTGDASGDFLFAALHRAGFASAPSGRRADDGLMLRDAAITAAVRCAPPANKPTREELAICESHFAAREMRLMPNLRVVVALGRIAFDSYLRLIRSRGVRVPSPAPRFAHGAVHMIDGAPTVVCTYHPSRQNTQTGRLTARMLDDVFAAVRRLL
jgi:uracil-DNA glycosylase family 4